VTVGLHEVYVVVVEVATVGDQLVRVVVLVATPVR
jgi:hypothetical protein